MSGEAEDAYISDYIRNSVLGKLEEFLINNSKSSFLGGFILNAINSIKSNEETWRDKWYPIIKRNLTQTPILTKDNFASYFYSILIATIGDNYFRNSGMFADVVYSDDFIQNVILIQEHLKNSK